jgi:hypothetical protein
LPGGQSHSQTFSGRGVAKKGEWMAMFAQDLVKEIRDLRVETNVFFDAKRGSHERWYE